MNLVPFLDAIADGVRNQPLHALEIEAYSPAYTVLRLIGEFDMGARSDLARALDEVSSTDSAIDVDLSKVTFLYSGAANTIIDAETPGAAA